MAVVMGTSEAAAQAQCLRGPPSLREGRRAVDGRIEKHEHDDDHHRERAARRARRRPRLGELRGQLDERGFAVTRRARATRSARPSPTSSTAGASARRSTWRATASATALSLLRRSAARRDRRPAQLVLPPPRADRERWSACSAATRTRSRSSTSELLERCHAAGQERPTPLILRYGEGDWNALHQDLYGDVYFPFQVLTVLSEPGVDFEGGEFVLLEQRPRAQSRAHVITRAARRVRDLPDPPAARSRARAATTSVGPSPRREHDHARARARRSGSSSTTPR